MIELIEIRLSEWMEDAQALFIEHWEEVAKVTGVPEPSLDLEYLEQAEESGSMFTIGAFVNEELVGYSVNSIGQTFNFDTLIIMDNEAIFIKKQYRAMLGGIRLIEESEKLAKERGATRAKWHTYTGTRAAALFDSLGYKPYDIIYTKEL